MDLGIGCTAGGYGALSDERYGRADRVIARLNQSTRSRIARKVLRHTVHDIARRDLVVRVGKAHRSARPGVTERSGAAIRSERRGGEEPQAEARLEEQTSVASLCLPLTG